MKIEEIDISNPDKLIFPKQNLTKLDMITYYDKIADRMLPFMKDRPLTLQRFPNGVDKDGFYQKNVPDYFPDFIERVSIETEDGINTQIICNTKKSLIYLANQGTVTYHIWLAQKDKLNAPDKVVFDLDPPENAFKKLKEATQKIGDFLSHEGKDPKLMTTGKSGFHIWYYKRRDKGFDKRREDLKVIAKTMEEHYPDLLTTAIRKDKRKNNIFIDYLRNAYGQTSVCPYSLRPVGSAGVATPIEWDELPKIEQADYYTYKNLFRRLGQKDH